MGAPTRNSRGRRRRKLRNWLIGLFVFYTVAGFFIVPPIVRSVAVKQLSKQLHRDVSIEKVKLNPFAFSGSIRGLLIKETNGTPFVSWDYVYANFQLMSLFGHEWVFKEVSVTHPFAHVQMNGDGSFNFSDLLTGGSTNVSAKTSSKPIALRVDRITVSNAVLSLKREAAIATADATPPPTLQPSTNAASDAILLLLQSITNAVGLLQNSTNAGMATIADLDVTNCAVIIEDLANPRPVHLTMDEICLTGKNLSNLGRTNFTTELSLRWNTNGVIKTDLSATLAPASADVHLQLNNLDLHPLDPYLDSKLNVFILGSKLGMDGRVRLRTTNGAMPEVVFTGDTWLDDFHTVDGVLAEDLLKWNSIRISGIDANLNPPVVAINEILADGVFARLVIETNRTINLLAALRLTNTIGAAESPAPAEEEKPKKSLLAGDTVIATNALEGLPLKKLSVARVIVTNTQANFSDRSITPNVDMAIERIHGSITGISSEELQRATVDLHASVDNVGPAEITGTINPFRGNETNEIKIAVNDVDLTPTSSYSGKFAGYRIAKGKLNLALEYHLHGRELKSENVITLDQFTFGEKVDSLDATKLPVRLAIAVLKDRQGKIILDVPIEGSLDDPKFRLRKVIIRTLGNILVKAATSPFAVLGAVFGGKGEEISYQDFAPGSVELTAPSKEKLDVLVKGLYERPGLQLDISGSVDPAADTEGLRTANLEKQLRAAKWLSLRKADRETTSAEQIEVTPEERGELVKKLYAEAMSKGLITAASRGTNAGAAAIPAVGTYFPAAPSRGATELLKKPAAAPVAAPQPAVTQSPSAADPMEAALLSSITVGENDFQSLASARAKTVREYILQSGKVEPERLFLTETQTASVKTNGSRVYLELK